MYMKVCKYLWGNPWFCWKPFWSSRLSAPIPKGRPWFSSMDFLLPVMTLALPSQLPPIAVSKTHSFLWSLRKASTTCINGLLYYSTSKTVYNNDCKMYLALQLSAYRQVSDNLSSPTAVPSFSLPVLVGLAETPLSICKPFLPLVAFPTFILLLCHVTMTDVSKCVQYEFLLLCCV